MQASNLTPGPGGATRVLRMGAAVTAAAWGLFLLLCWQLTLLQSLRMDPRAALAWIIAVTVALLLVYTWAPRRRRARARLRVRWPRRAWPWLLVMAPAFASLPQALWVALQAFGMAHDPPPQPELDAFIARPFGEPAFWLLAIGAAPLVEEFGFRGWIQRPLERGFGPMPAIATSAFLFALAHGEPELIPIRLAAGLVLGHAVWASRSIWSGVLLHLAWNLGALALDMVARDVDASNKGWEWGVPAAVVAALCLLLCAWTVKRMQDAAAPRPARARLTPAAEGPSAR
ncbi:CPBP family intramembrane glutamic endopeptidase [Longimicrobium terrae]|uniref:Membrane protease YdiL (CAAX protease family) n=1 Tax=Longimicrobium terrae TaxID=1639882 RepID=A0A841H3L7_9BACT|nr:type II CAAX endopeptidase family protein [Longimicrobium terrae]MBB4638364.1 membrane protease YdiL (CAAX protease family) [Longimicrobium terrae]MBB6072568.1 membrane protease YdiL (CAAX protease family) [Longimicrobium terrae]NNC28653.1 CPBP family intramembrane metalloprotease [Longimicrobium terrae]